jgi:hypothetical protein
VVAAQSVFSATPDRQDAWERLELDLRTEWIPLEYLWDNRHAVRTIFWSVVESNNLAGDRSGFGTSVHNAVGSEVDIIYANDSVSQVHGKLRL